jgi:coenzyme F420-0:L-glutamate ligase/coenzyme F420-1:gamma-L-glutamate ligase
MKVCCYTLDNVPLIKKGDDLAQIIAERTSLEEKDIIVIASSVVAKAEQGSIPLECFTPTKRAVEIAEKNNSDPRFVQAVLDNSKEILIDKPFLLVVRENGHICVNAGIDVSNIEEPDAVTLLPHDADESARKLQRRLKHLTGVNVGVVIIDTNGRAFREGQSGVAIGVASVQVMHDWRGTPDLYGRMLEVKHEAILDEIAGFANLLMGEGSDGTPIVQIQGLKDLFIEDADIREIFRKPEIDVIRKALKTQRDNTTG